MSIPTVRLLVRWFSTPERSWTDWSDLGWTFQLGLEAHGVWLPESDGSQENGLAL